MSAAMRFLAFCAVIGGATPCAAEDAPLIASIRYDFAFAGLPFGYTQYEETLGHGAYGARAHFETRGLVGVFWHAIIDVTTSGRYGADAIQPAAYESLFQRRHNRKEHVTIDFTGKIPVTSIDPPLDMSATPITDEQKKSGLDPMSAIDVIALGLTVDAQNPCGTAAPVFDGRRRYDLQFRYIKDMPALHPLTPTARVIRQCQLRYVPVAGVKQTVFKEGEEWPEIYAFFAEIPNASLPKGRYFVATKIWAKTRWGTVEANLAQHDVHAAGAAGQGEQTK